MKTDTTYSMINVCPKTQTQMSSADTNDSNGVCPYCGHINDYSFTHSKKVAGRWNRPSFRERWIQGAKAEFIRKDAEDALLSSLTQ